MKRPLAECFSVWERRKSVGDFIYKTRNIDRAANLYEERVVTEAGEVLRDISEPLTKHIGHGSAKSRK